MKMRWFTLAAVALLSSCLFSGMPDWEDLPGDDCSLVTHRLLTSRADTSLMENQGKKVTLRESEKADLREYLRLFSEQAEVSMVTYAPRTVLYGEDFSLNFQTDKVILNIGAGNRRQYVRPMTEVDKDMLQLLRKRSDSRALKR